MNSTSSGNSNVSDRSSSSSSGSSAGEELQTSSSEAKKRSSNGNEASGVSTSPALPLFCLGNSFPHIDSDEEPSDCGGVEKQHSLGKKRRLYVYVIPHYACAPLAGGYKQLL